MNARARIEVFVEDLLFSLVTQDNGSTTLRCTLFDVIYILCDWINKDTAQGETLRCISVSDAERPETIQRTYILSNSISCDGRFPKAIRSIFFSHSMIKR
jgi:hypothetical protein